MIEYKQVTPDLSVRPQIELRELPEVAARGFKGIINSRPDDEEPGQPKSHELEAEAQRLGLAYWHIPVVPGQATAADAQKFEAAVRQCDGPVVAFCKTGNRAAGLWEMAQPSRES